MKTLNKIIAVTIVGIFSIAPALFSAPILGNYGNDGPNHNNQMYAVTLQQVRLDGNNIDAFFYNVGIFNQDLRTSNAPGLFWPKGTPKTACFTAGLSMG